MIYESNFPERLDGDDNLFVVRDALMLSLAQDYYPGQRIIYVEGAREVFDKFPKSGIITLTDQVSDRDSRSVSLSYGSRDNMMFIGLEILPEQRDCYKPRTDTRVTQNVMSAHRMALVSSILSIERFLGAKGTADAEPFGETIMGRLNYLRKIILSPKAWFSADVVAGSVPLTVVFTADSAPENATYIWSFGDGVEQTTLEPKVERLYSSPGVYDVSLKIVNDFGDDYVSFPEMIKAMSAPPAASGVEFVPSPGQVVVDGRLRTPVDMPVSVRAKPVERGMSESIDPIAKYTWNLSNDLGHGDSAKALYGIGGVYDLSLRADTKYGSYRITSLPKCIDAVEDVNLWLWTDNQAKEFGLTSETFKSCATRPHNAAANSSFLSSALAKREFERNFGFSKRKLSSGKGGACVLSWATGRNYGESAMAEAIAMTEYCGFTDTYSSLPSISGRAWNWIFLPGVDDMYFVMGVRSQLKTTVSLGSLAVKQEPLTLASFKGGSQEFMERAYFSVYRTAWKDYSGYILRNKPGSHASLTSFYKTDGTVGNPFMMLRKLPSLSSPVSDCRLVAMSQGIYCFSNAGVSIYDTASGSWRASAAISLESLDALRDKRALGYDDPGASLLAASDGVGRAYLSFDYSLSSFVKFNEADMCFRSLGRRAEGKQRQMEIY